MHMVRSKSSMCYGFNYSLDARLFRKPLCKNPRKPKSRYPHPTRNSSCTVPGHAHPNLLFVAAMGTRFHENPFRCSTSNARISLSFDHGGWAYIPLSDASFLGHWARVLVGVSLGRSYLLCKRDGSRRRVCGSGQAWRRDRPLVFIAVGTTFTTDAIVNVMRAALRIVGFGSFISARAFSAGL